MTERVCARERCRQGESNIKVDASHNSSWLPHTHPHICTLFIRDYGAYKRRNEAVALVKCVWNICVEPLIFDCCYTAACFDAISSASGVATLWGTEVVSCAAHKKTGNLTWKLVITKACLSPADGMLQWGVLVAGLANLWVETSRKKKKTHAQCYC